MIFYYLFAAIIKSVTFMTVYCSRMWWPPDKSLGGALNLCLFTALSGMTIFNFLSAAYIGPGLLPKGWCPVSDFTIKMCIVRLLR